MKDPVRYQNASNVLREGLRMVKQGEAEDASRLEALRSAVIGDLKCFGILRANEDATRAGPDFRIFPQASDASSAV